MWENNIHSASIPIMNPGKMKLELKKNQREIQQGKM